MFHELRGREEGLGLGYRSVEYPQTPKHAFAPISHSNYVSLYLQLLGKAATSNDADPDLVPSDNDNTFGTKPLSRVP